MNRDETRAEPSEELPVREDPRGHPEEDIHPDEIHRWAREFGVSAEELRIAIERVGPVSSEVKKFLEAGRAGTRGAPAGNH
jgi:hypothetical protein